MADLGSWNIFFPSSSHDGLEFGMGVFHLLYKKYKGGGMSWATGVGGVWRAV